MQIKTMNHLQFHPGGKPHLHPLIVDSLTDQDQEVKVSQKTILRPGDGTLNALKVKIDIPATFLNMSLNKDKRMACS